MKKLVEFGVQELDNLEMIETSGGSDCLGAMLGAGAAGAVVGAISGALTTGIGAAPGLAQGWLLGALGGLIECAVSGMFVKHTNNAISRPNLPGSLSRV